MNIAIISPGPFSVPPVNGSSVEHDIDEISRVFSLEHQVIIYTRTCPQYPESSVEENRHYIRLPYTTPSHYLTRVIRDLRKRKADLILVENRPAYVLSLRKKFPRTPIVLNMHSHVFASKRSISSQDMKRVKKAVDAVLTNSFFLRSHFIEHHRIPDRKVHAVHLGVHTPPYQLANTQEAINELRQRLNISPDDRVLLFAGRLIKQKGVHLLLKSFRKIVELDDHARLMIIGGPGYGRNHSTKYVRWLHKLAQPLGEKVKFIDFIPTAEMPLWYQIADVVATPSVWEEPFCRVNLEAMASAKPILTSTRGGIAEVVLDQSHGYLISPRKWVEQAPEAWQLFWNDPNTRATLSINALQRAEQFSWEATAQGYLRVFSKAIKRKKES